MSQWAANLMASQGRNAANIINYFFSGVRITKMWP